jgi:hypothetical protein
MASNAEQDTARPRFYMQAVENKAKSTLEGRPVFDEREMVEIRIPGDRLATHVNYVLDEHRQRWPDHYAAFKRGEARAASGTPLEHWPPMTTGRVATLKALGILSVEELANLPDNMLGSLGMGARELRDQARAYLAAAQDGAATSRQAAENAELRAHMLRMQQQMEALMASAQPQAVVDVSERAIEDLSDDELKAYIKRETGEGVRGTPSRQTLLDKAEALAMRESEAA